MAYKIVRSFLDTDGNIRFASLTRTDRGTVLYNVGKPTKPWSDCGPLAAFETLEAVKLFKKENGWGDSPVFRCRVKRDIKRKTLFVTTREEEKSLDVVVEEKRPLPWGTVLCKEIILTEYIP